MKKCPYCAEEIQDEAIVCRYCGRDLIPPVQPSDIVADVTPAKPSKPTEKTIWQASRPAAIVIAILYVLNVFLAFVRFPSSGELVGDLTLGLAVTFFVWWAICALIVWLWRAMGGGGFLLVGMVVLMAGAIIWNNVPTNSFSAPPTATRAPTRVPTRTPIPTATLGATEILRISNCERWHEITNDHIGNTICAQGTVRSITGNTETSPITRIYFSNGPDSFYFADDGYYYTDLAVGDCVSATGRISINENGRLFMRLDGKLNTCE